MSNLGVDVHLSNVILIQLEVNLCCKAALNLSVIYSFMVSSNDVRIMCIGNYKLTFIKNQVYCTESG